MASMVYTSFLRDVATGAIDCDADTFYVVALGAAYSESKNHTKRSDLTSEVSGTGYAAGGKAVTVTVNSTDTVNNRVDVSLGGAEWPTSTISAAQKFAYYKRRGGAASADELVALVDNGTPVSTSGTTLTLTSSTLRIQN